MNSSQWLNLNENYVVPATPSPGLAIFCAKPEEKTLTKLWLSITLHISTMSESIDVFQGTSPAEVHAEFQKSNEFFSFANPWKMSQVNFDPFNMSCAGIVASEQYSVTLTRHSADPWFIMLLVIGLIFFITAGILSRHALFYYSSGMLIGLLASVLIVVFILSRFVPKKNFLGWTVLVCGWSVAAYLLQYSLENIRTFVTSYPYYGLAYFVVVGFLTFAFLYYRGPPSDHRTFNLIKWSIQLIALVLIYNGTAITEISVLLVVLCIAIPQLCHLGEICMKFTKRLLGRVFPAKRKLLTLEEYEEEGRRETEKALAGLREYCKSPECKPWQLAKSLHAPSKFASFIEGECDEFSSNNDFLMLPAPNGDPWHFEEESDIEFTDEELNGSGDEGTAELSYERGAGDYSFNHTGIRQKKI